VDEQGDTIGFLAADGALYCSQSCALLRGQSAGYEVDEDEYEGLLEGGSLAAGGVCPGCGAEFAVAWPEHQPN
jgi:hypothetical protein